MKVEYSIDFAEHPSFSKKIRKFLKRYHDDRALERLRKLLLWHFDPNDSIPISSKMLRPINKVGPNIEAYKVDMAVADLKRGQFPRVCFWRLGKEIIFLCYGSHLKDYKDSELKELVKKRIKEISAERGLKVSLQ